MTQPPANDETLREMIAAWREDRLTADQAARLNAELAADPSAREVFAGYALLQASLELELGAARPPVATSSDLLPAPASPGLPFHINTTGDTPGRFTETWSFAYLVSLVVCGFGLLIASVVTVSGPAEVAKDPPKPAVRRFSESELAFVGRITGMVDCEWADDSTFAFSGADVPLGRKYALSSGLLEITYKTGATVLLQGPCTYKAESKTGGYLSVGKLMARVEKGPRSKAQGPGTAAVVSGRKSEIRNQKSEIPNPQSLIPNPSLSTLHSPLFTITTPTATVTDLGTEFGVEVGDSGYTSATVFLGVVEMQPLGEGGQRGQVVRLTENESARVEKGPEGRIGAVRHVAVDSAAFVRAGEIARLAKELRLKAFRRWQASSEVLRRDPSLLAYYDFQLVEGKPSVLRNLAGEGDKSLDGLVEGSVWSTGRMAGKHALLFNNPADYVGINLPQKTDDLTLAAWVCFDRFDVPDASALLMSNGWVTPGKTCWQVGNDGRMCFSTTSAAEGSGNAFAPTSLGREDLRRWIHLACVYERAAKQVRFYMDGRNVGDVEYETKEPIAIGPARIGNWNPEEIPYARMRNLYGRMDELAIFGRPLTADEVQKMYEQGKL